MFKSLFRKKEERKDKYFSQFGGLWIDRVDADFDFEEEITRRGLEAMAEQLHFFRDHGFLIIKNAVDAETIEQIKRDAESYLDNPTHYVIRKAGHYFRPEDIPNLQDKHRIIDLYGASEAARKAIFNEKTANFLHAIFAEPAIAMQSLSFLYGSEQSIHQDTAYVISRQPLQLAASWIALEDVQPGSGELLYYPGSHRFEEYLFGGKSKAWQDKSEAGKQDHQKFLASLHEKAVAKNIEVQAFLPKAGDVLVWHADLAHGGNKISKPDVTRKSLVAHYVPQSVKPNYLRFPDAKSNYYELPYRGHYFTSRHYRMKTIEEGGAPDVFYEGGARK